MKRSRKKEFAQPQASTQGARSKGETNKVRIFFTEIIGWYGVIVILIAYALLNFNIFTSSSLLYQILNLTGSVGILFEAYTKRDYEPVILNLIWAIIALIVIIRILFLYF